MIPIGTQVLTIEGIGYITECLSVYGTNEYLYGVRLSSKGLPKYFDRDENDITPAW